MGRTMVGRAWICGLLLAVVVGAAPRAFGADDGSLTFEDAHGDVRGADVPVALPPSPYADTLDVTGGGVGSETVASLDLWMDVASLDENAMLAHFATGLRPRYEFRFALTSDAGAAWRVAFVPTHCVSCDGYPFFETNVCRRAGETEECRSGGTVTRDGDRLAYRFPRDAVSLLGAPALPRAGDAMNDIRAVATNGPFADHAPDVGMAAPAYVFRVPARDETIEVRFPEHESLLETGLERGVLRPAAAIPGGTTLIPVTLRSHLAEGTVVRLVSALDADSPSSWSVVVPDQVYLPPGGVARVTAVLRLEIGLAHRSEASWEVRATPVAAPDRPGTARLVLLAAETPTAARNVLHLHADERPLHLYGPLGRTVRAVEPSFWNVYAGWMNTVGGRVEDAELPILGAENAAEEWWFELDTPLAQDLRFNLEAESTARFALRSSYPIRVHLRVELFAGEVHLGGARTTAALESDAKLVEMRFGVPLHEPWVRSAGQPLRMYVRVENLDVTSPPASAYLFASGPTRTVFLVTSSSSVELPLLPVSYPVLTGSSGGRLLSLQVMAEGRGGPYVNPGEWRSLRLSLTNLGVFDEAVDLRATPSLGSWQAHVDEGRVPALVPGENRTISLRVRAPVDAAEGQRATVELRATSRHDARVTATVTLEYVATTGVDVPGSEAPATVARRGNETPDVAVPLLVVAAACVLYLRRARRPSDGS